MSKYAIVKFVISGCGVTANMPALGAGDSGFESLHPDKFGILDYMNKHIKIILIIIGLAVVALVAAIVVVRINKTSETVLESQNQTLVSPSGKLTIDNLDQNQTIALPMAVTGTAQGWFFEGSFPVFMKDSNGNQIGVGLASSSQDWMTGNAIPFSVTLPAVNYTGQGTLVFTKDNPSGEPQFDDSFVVSVIFQ